MANEITSQTSLQEIMSLPGAEEVLSQYKVPCLTCPVAKFEMEDLKIGEICKIYDLDEKGLIEALNKIAK